MMKTNRSVSDYGYLLFSKSMVTSRFLEGHKIKMKVKEFKEYIKTQPHQVVLVGGFDGNTYKYKRVKVWNISQITYSLRQKDL